MTRQLAGPFGCVYSESDDLIFDEKKLLDSAKYNLRHRFIFGITENFADAMFHIQHQLMLLSRVELATWLGGSPITTGLNMQSESKKHMKYVQRNSTISHLSEEEIFYAKKCAHLDIQLFEYGIKLYNSRMNAKVLSDLYTGELHD